MSDPVSVQIQGRVALVTIDHPPANAISRAVVDGLRAAVAGAAAGGEVRALVITGAGSRFFAAGADVSEFPSAGGSVAEGGQQLTLEIERSPLATIAAVNGMAFGGGCEIALACDIRIAARTARLGQPEINLGIIPGWGGTQRLARATNIGYAKELILTGRMVDAEEALERGLVQHVYKPGDLMARAMELAQLMASKSPVALYYAKESTNRALHGDIGGNLVHEADLYSLMFSTEDAKEGLRAFVEKRNPTFIGK